MTELQTFKNPEFGEIRTVMVDGDPWFVGKDVATVLGYKDSVNALKAHVDDEDKAGWQITTQFGEKTATVINESGLYSLILSSKLPTARQFKRWVTSEVLPSIRRTGRYATPKEKLVCDVPENFEAQRIMKEMRDLATAMSVLLEQYNVYRSEDARRSYAAVLSSICGRLNCKSMELEQVKYRQIEKM